MPKYKVHIYPIVVVPVQEVEADSPEQACKKAELIFGESVDRSDGLIRAEYADDIDSFLVDFENDPEHEMSTRYNSWYRPI